MEVTPCRSSTFRPFPATRHSPKRERHGRTTSRSAGALPSWEIRRGVPGVVQDRRDVGRERPRFPGNLVLIVLEEREPEEAVIARDQQRLVSSKTSRG